jgi:hypothetical protein
MEHKSSSPLNAGQRAELQRLAEEAHKTQGTGLSSVDAAGLVVDLTKAVGKTAVNTFNPFKNK